MGYRRRMHLRINSRSLGRSYLAYLFPRAWWKSGLLRWMIYGVFEPMLLLGMTWLVLVLTFAFEWVPGLGLAGYLFIMSLDVWIKNVGVLRTRRKRWLARHNAPLDPDFEDAAPHSGAPSQQPLKGHRVR